MTDIEKNWARRSLGKQQWFKVPAATKENRRQWNSRQMGVWMTPQEKSAWWFLSKDTWLTTKGRPQLINNKAWVEIEVVNKDIQAWVKVEDLLCCGRKVVEQAPHNMAPTIKKEHVALKLEELSIGAEVQHKDGQKGIIIQWATTRLPTPSHQAIITVKVNGRPKSYWLSELSKP